MDPASLCEIDGNRDLYGRGIRLSFYLQWISTLLVTLFKQEEEQLMRVVNLILQLAVFAALLFLTVNDDLYAFEAMIAFWLLFGALSSLTGDGFSPLRTLGGLARTVMYAALSGYGLWFWYMGGLDTLKETPCEPILFYGGVSTTNAGFRTFGKVMSFFGLVVCGLLMVSSVGLAMIRMWKAVEHRMEDNATGTEGRVETMRRRGRPQTELSLLVLSVFVIVFSILSAEELIKDNHVVDVNDVFDAGQLIPLLIGAMGLFSTLLSILVRRSFFKPRCWLIFGYHLT